MRLSRVLDVSLTGACLAAALVVTVDASGTPAAPSPPQKVTSADGGLTVFVPRGAMGTSAKVRIRTLRRSQFPPELKKVTFRPGSHLYALEPAGLRFRKPVTITRRIDTRVAGFKPKDGAPMIVLGTRSAQGKWELLTGHRARLAGKTLVVTAKTRHFSTVVAFDGSYRLKLVPPTAVKTVGETFYSTVVISPVKGGPTPSSIEIEHKFTADQKIVSVAAGSYWKFENGAGMVCEAQGSGWYGADVRSEDFDLVISLLTLGTRGFAYYYELRSVAHCKQGFHPPPTNRFSLAQACLIVSHHPFGGFPSFTRWVLQFVPATLVDDARAFLTADGVNNGQAVSAPIDRTTGKVELVGGISSYGAKKVEKLQVSGIDVTQQLVKLVGAAPAVTSSEGVAAGSCPP